MGNALRNAAGTLIGENGFVLCCVCMRECDMLSRETALKYAYCSVHCSLNLSEEVSMPTVPKPSQAKKVVLSTVTKVYKRTCKPPAAKIEKVVNGKHQSHAIPTKGKSGAWLEEIKNNGGVTKLELTEGCIAHGLGQTMDVAMMSYCKRLNLLKD
jgi:hypothetical protein